MVSLIEAVILSIIQGITEWFPVSSSGHLAILHDLFGMTGLSFAVYLHFASVFAIIVVFWKDIIRILDLRDKENYRRIFFIVIAIIPAGFVGYFLKNQIEVLFLNMIYLGVFFILSGIVIYSTRFSREKKSKIGFFDALFIGLFQIFGLFAGVSRSGMTISAGLFRGLKRRSAVVFSFLLAIPMILGASLLELDGIVNSGVGLDILIVSFIVVFLVSVFTIKILLRIINRGGFWWFGVYNIVLGVAVLVWGLV